MENIDRIIIAQPDAFGGVWFIGWLFTIGYLRLTFWKGVLGIIIWPYYLGRHFTKITKAHGENQS